MVADHLSCLKNSEEVKKKNNEEVKKEGSIL